MGFQSRRIEIKKPALHVVCSEIYHAVGLGRKLEILVISAKVAVDQKVFLQSCHDQKEDRPRLGECVNRLRSIYQ